MATLSGTVSPFAAVIARFCLYFKVFGVQYGFWYWWQSLASSELEFEIVKYHTIRNFH
jgi:hypothetical protein